MENITRTIYILILIFTSICAMCLYSATLKIKRLEETIIEKDIKIQELQRK